MQCTSFHQYEFWLQVVPGIHSLQGREWHWCLFPQYVKRYMTYILATETWLCADLVLALWTLFVFWWFKQSTATWFGLFHIYHVMISRRVSGRTSFVSFSVHATATVELSSITSSIIIARARACSWSIVRASILVDTQMRMPNCGYSCHQIELRASVTLPYSPCRNHLAINCPYATNESVAISGFNSF